MSHQDTRLGTKPLLQTHESSFGTREQSRMAESIAGSGDGKTQLPEKRHSGCLEEVQAAPVQLPPISGDIGHVPHLAYGAA